MWGVPGCARVYAGVRGLAWVWAGVHGYALVCTCVLDDFSEFCKENRVPTSVDFNTYPIRIFRYVCECVSRRAGFMVSAGITALLKKMDYKDVVVAIDGSVFRYHPHFPNIMKSRISQLMGIDYKFDLMLSTDGSGRGAALVAAVLNGECQI